jgi:predicted nucleic acid-binding protein
MKPQIYLETSTISYLTARLSRDLVMAARQQITQEWWAKNAGTFELYVSELVWEEAKAGHIEAAQKRLNIISQLSWLSANETAKSLAYSFIHQKLLPMKATNDAVHIAIATIHGMDYLMTWNCKHIANAVIQKSLRRLIEAEGYEMPVICTPEELLVGGIIDDK